MTAYVDEAVWEWRGRFWCHLFADSIEELHQFAKQIGLQKTWYQGKACYPHYDITDSMRERALEFGAHHADKRKIVDVSAKLKLERDRPQQRMEQLSLL